MNDICKENNITYFIAFGTLLGAIRHGGFIPWDDNLYIYIYIYINDKGLKKLRKIINNGNYPYVIQDYSSDKGFVRYYSVLRDTNSEYIKMNINIISVNTEVYKLTYSLMVMV